MAWTLTNKKTGATRSFGTRQEARKFQREHSGQYRSAEYERRVTPRPGAPPLSRSQLRGHARGAEPSLRTLQGRGVIERAKPQTLDKYFRAIQNVAKGQSLSNASKNAGISPHTVRRLDRERGMLGKTYEGRTFKGWEVAATATYPILTADGEYFERVQLDAKAASVVGRYWNDVRMAINTGELERLNRWHGVEVRDVEGKVYTLNTDPDEMAMFFEQMTDAEHAGFNRAFDSERVRIRRAS